MICKECMGYFPSDDAYQQHKCPLEAHEVINSLSDRIYDLEEELAHAKKRADNQDEYLRELTAQRATGERSEKR